MIDVRKRLACRQLDLLIVKISLNIRWYVSIKLPTAMAYDALCILSSV